MPVSVVIGCWGVFLAVVNSSYTSLHVCDVFAFIVLMHACGLDRRRLIATDYARFVCTVFSSGYLCLVNHRRCVC